jgi:hypothetical protein
MAKIFFRNGNSNVWFFKSCVTYELLFSGLDTVHTGNVSVDRVVPYPLVPVLRIRIRMFLGLPDPDPLVRGTDLAPDPSIIKQNSKINLDSFCFDFFLTFLSLKSDVNVTLKSNKQKA